jgi:Uma2 family endonuclease
MNAIVPLLMTVDDFLLGAPGRDEGKCELIDGRLVAQPGERWLHLATKGRLYVVLLAGIERAKVPFFAATEGVSVVINATTVFRPDALVAPLPHPDPNAVEVQDPVLVVEVLSPQSMKADLADKVGGYFQLMSVAHYLIVDPAAREIIWHRRSPAGGLEPPLTVREGTLRIDPPGIELKMAEIFRS